MAPIKIGRRAVIIALIMRIAAPISGKADEIDHYITAQMQRLHIPGLSLAIVRDGRITKAQGLRLRESGTKNSGQQTNCLRNWLEHETVHRSRNHDACRGR